MTWGFIGCGNLAQSLILGALEQKILDPRSILITNRTVKKSKAFGAKTGVGVAASNDELVQKSDVIFLGTKPLEIHPVLEEVSRHDLSHKIIVCLASGVGAPLLKKYFGRSRSVFRVMANTPATIQKGLFGIYPIWAKPEDTQQIFDLFSELGEIVSLKNDKEVDMITVGSASGVGFIFSFMEEFETWLVKKGLDPKLARTAVVETFLGASELAKIKTDQTLSSLREVVTSQKGTTFAGLKAFRAAGVPTGLRSGLDSALKRCQEIAKSLIQKQK